MITLDKLQILKMHRDLIKSTDGTHGIRDITALEESINSSFANLFINSDENSIISKAARIACNIIKTKPFIDGNTNLAIYSALVILESNNIIIDYKDNELISIARSLTYMNTDLEKFIDWIKSHISN